LYVLDGPVPRALRASAMVAHPIAMTASVPHTMAANIALFQVLMVLPLFSHRPNLILKQNLENGYHTVDSMSTKSKDVLLNKTG